MTVTAVMTLAETADTVAIVTRAAFPATALALVKFTASCTTPRGCYACGDIAGFPYAFAQALIAKGEATLYDAGDGAGYVL